MKRAMVLTVGTSLYHSATWNHAGPLADLADYAAWLGNAYLGDPERRHQDIGVSGALGKALDGSSTPTEVAAWAAALPGELTGEGPVEEPMRYSAELATLIKLGGEQSLRELLRSFDAIYLPCDPATTAAGPEVRRSFVAALQLREYLTCIAGKGPTQIDLWKIPHLAETTPGRLLPALKGLRLQTKDLRDQCDRLDLVVTGGYKVYGYVLTSLATRDVHPKQGTRLHYLYERGHGLMTLDAQHIQMGGEEVTLDDEGYLS